MTRDKTIPAKMNPDKTTLFVNLERIGQRKGSVIDVARPVKECDRLYIGKGRFGT